MESCLEALSKIRGEGLSGREPRSDFNMIRQRGHIGWSPPSRSEIAKTLPPGCVRRGCEGVSECIGERQVHGRVGSLKLFFF